jgi:hypothetical protein
MLSGLPQSVPLDNPLVLQQPEPVGLDDLAHGLRISGLERH